MRILSFLINTIHFIQHVNLLRTETVESGGSWFCRVMRHDMSNTNTTTQYSLATLARIAVLYLIILSIL